MTLRIGRAVGNGLRRAWSPIGALLSAAVFGYSLVFTASVNTLTVAALRVPPGRDAAIGLWLPVRPAVAGLLAAIAMLVGLVTYLVGARAFTREGPDRGAIRADLATRRMGRAVLSAVAANVVTSLAILVGFVLLVVPGVFLTVSFAFVVLAIAVEDRRAIDALRRSWGLARGTRWRLLVLLVIVGAATGALASVGSLVSLLDAAAGQVVSLLVAAPLVIAGYAVLAEAYLQVRDDGATEPAQAPDRSNP